MSTGPRLSPLEIRKLWISLEPDERAAAEARAKAGSTPWKFPGGRRSEAGAVRDRIGRLAGVSGRTVEKVVQVFEAAERDPALFGPVLEYLVRSENVHDAHKRMRRVADFERVRNLAPVEGRFTTLVLDPPWEDDSVSENQRPPYATMSLAEIAAVPFDENEYLQEVGARALWGEPGYSPLERAWARPTLDFNGIWGGFQGEGVKTVTPCEAHLKITCRLVPEQEPEEILALIEQHVAHHTPPWAEVTVERFPGSARPFAIRRDHPALQTARAVLRDLYGKEPLAIRLGGTLPVAEVFQRELGADMVFFAWGMPDSRVHAPNESYRLEDFRTMARAYCRYLTALARA